MTETNETGYKYEDPVTITFGQLKEAQNEAYLEGINKALAEIRRFYKTGDDFNTMVGFLRKTKLYEVPAKATDEAAE
jgi:hypothetical protein